MATVVKAKTEKWWWKCLRIYYILKTASTHPKRKGNSFWCCLNLQNMLMFPLRRNKLLSHWLMKMPKKWQITLKPSRMMMRKTNPFSISGMKISWKKIRNPNPNKCNKRKDKCIIWWLIALKSLDQENMKISSHCSISPWSDTRSMKNIIKHFISINAIVNCMNHMIPGIASLNF